MSEHPESPQPQRDALRHARKLSLTLLDEAQAREDRSRRGEPPTDDVLSAERRARLAAAELPALMLFAGILAQTLPSEARVALRRVHDRPAPITAKALREAIKAGPHYGLAYTIVERYVRQRPRLSPRTHYNVACFYSKLGAEDDGDLPRFDPLKVACQDRALDELDLGLVDASLLPWALEDPSLRPLQAARGDDWTAVIKRRTPRPAPAPPSAEPATEAAAQPPRPEEPATSEGDDALATWAVAHVVAAFGRGEVRSIRRGTAVDFEVETQEGAVLVDMKSYGVVTVPDVERLRRAQAERRDALVVLIIGPRVRFAQDAQELALELGMPVIRLSEGGQEFSF